MLTWLDDYLREIERGVDSEYADRVKDAIKRGIIKGGLELARELTLQIMENPEYYRRMTGFPEPRKRAPAKLSDFMFPFLFPDRARGTAIQLSPDLADLFHNTKVKGEYSYENHLAKLGVVYIDVPPGAYRYDERHEIRAIFIKREESNTIFYVVMATDGRYDPRTAAEFIFHDLEDDLWWVSLGRPTHEIENAPFMQRIRDIVKLTVLYYESELESRQKAKALKLDYEDVIEDLPFIPEERLEKLSLDKQKAKRKTYSLFKVKRLSPPRSKFNKKSEARPQGGWTLTKRVEVSAYFRMQPYGAGKALRRLQLISGYVKNPEAEVQPEIVVLKPPKN